ncbi:OmpA family protein [Lutibacter sp.]|uniref:OmpA family protein n=1 Tax=Lutibacter sp. TaxID=1925666 RepID=UPI001A216821|nr:OmpA family protein [Lutibacter sp.]MBI9041126.1 OmpA family protein [Lutibacter sp.]
MLNNSKALITFVIWSIIALTFHYFISNKIFHNCFSETENTKVNSTEINRPLFVITDFKNNSLFTFNETITIIKNKDSVLFSSNKNTVLDSVKNYLLNNYDKNCSITGYFSSEENSANLGFKRADYFKNLLISNNVDSARIETNQFAKQHLFTQNNKALNGVKLQFKTRNPHLIDSIEQTIANKILHIIFTDENTIIDSIQLNTYLPLLKKYCKKQVPSEISITGHTDNDGYFQNNIVKGLNWANATRDYFIKKGLKSINITTTSKGEAEPIANKYTEEGKAKNRRIEIKIIK